MIRPKFASFSPMVFLAWGLILASCAHDTYQERANLIKNHTGAFYDNLKANRVESGVRSYSQVVSLILRVRFEEGWRPVRPDGPPHGGADR